MNLLEFWSAPFLIRSCTEVYGLLSRCDGLGCAVGLTVIIKLCELAIIISVTWSNVFPVEIDCKLISNRVYSWSIKLCVSLLNYGIWWAHMRSPRPSTDVVHSTHTFNRNVVNFKDLIPDTEESRTIRQTARHEPRDKECVLLDDVIILNLANNDC